MIFFAFWQYFFSWLRRKNFVDSHRQACNAREGRKEGGWSEVCVAMRFPCNSLSLSILSGGRGEERRKRRRGKEKVFPRISSVSLFFLGRSSVRIPPPSDEGGRRNATYAKTSVTKSLNLISPTFFFGDCRKEREKGKSDFLPSPPFFSR